MMPRRLANPPNPWQSTAIDWLGEAPPVVLEVYEEDAKSIVTKNDSPDVPFTWSVNPYRGCFHGCAYCYARPTHEYLGWGAGTDFERRIVVKRNAPELLEQALARKSWRRETIVFSGVTDCYQPLEASFALTRRCLQACLRHDTPAGVVTKGALVERDADLLAELERRAGAMVYVSVPFADDALARAIEPWAPVPSRRLQAIAALVKAGVPTGVAVAPVIPGLNDDQIPAVLRAARQAGAQRAFLIALRLPGSVEAVFFERLAAVAPLRRDRVESTVRQVRGGALSSARFGTRMAGQGARWQAIEQLFAIHCRKLGLGTGERGISDRPRPRPRQGELFR